VDALSEEGSAAFLREISQHQMVLLLLAAVRQALQALVNHDTQCPNVPVVACLIDILSLWWVKPREDLALRDTLLQS